MFEGDQLRYGHVQGGKSAVPVPMYASEVIAAPGARFINVRTDGYGEFLDDGDSAECFGHSEGPYSTRSAVSGQDIDNVIIDLTAIFKVPILAGDGTYAITMLGDTCDVAVTTNVQGALLTSSSNEQFIIYGGDTKNNNWCLVGMNPVKRGQTDVA